MREQEVLAALESGLAMATGCTEPVALAYAGAVAAARLEAAVEAIELCASANIIKNAFVVGIPGTEFTGLKYAVALGALCRNPDKKLELLEDVTPEIVERARTLVEGEHVVLTKCRQAHRFYIEAVVRGGGQCVRVEMVGSHTNITRIEKDGQVLYNGGVCDDEDTTDDCFEFTLEDIFQVCLSVDVDKLAIVRQAIELNLHVSDEGLEGEYGLRVGRVMQSNIEHRLMSDDIANYAMMRTSAASDARMAGVCLPVMTNSGSGNQGIAATVPVVAVWEKRGSGDGEQLVRACAMSNLAAIYIKKKFGILSAFCGAVAAAAGSAYAIAWLLGGSLEQMENAIQNTLGNVAGMLCDGAKASCALKISTCTNAAVQAAILALGDLRIQSNEGFVERLAEHTIDNFAALGNLGSVSLDNLILDMIIHKKV